MANSPQRESLFDFDPVSAQSWRERLEKDLKGKSFTELITRDSDGIPILPFYTSADREFIRHSIAKPQNTWDITESFFANSNEAEVNTKILTALNGGVNSVLLYVYSDVDIPRLLADVQVPIIRINWVVEGDVMAFTRRFFEWVDEMEWERSSVLGNINFDILENRARTGNWRKSLESDFDELSQLVSILPNGMNSLAINANLYHNSGATPVQELALSLAMINEYIERGIHGKSYWVNLAVGGQYFHDIAKLRAIRELLAFYSTERGVEFDARIYAETATYNKTIFDLYNNMVRNTIEASAAVIGGADEVLVHPHDAALGKDSALGRRIARNTQLLLVHESHFQNTTDPAKGSFFVEELTGEMCEKAWSLFLKIEEMGGFIAALESGWIPELILNAHLTNKAEFDDRNRTLIGVNAFPNEADRVLDEKELTLWTDQSDRHPLQPTRLAADWEYKMWKNRAQ